MPCKCKAKQVAKGAFGIAKAALRIGHAEPAEVERRRDLCRGCEFAVPCVGNKGRKCKCDKCGCWLKAKTLIKDETCPEGKW